MEEFLKRIPDWVQVFALAGMCVSFLATLLVRITPSKADDETAAKALTFFLKVLHWLPTIGVNPQTKELQEKLEAQLEKK